jgi:hypothetical protein
LEITLAQTDVRIVQAIVETIMTVAAQEVALGVSEVHLVVLRLGWGADEVKDESYVGLVFYVFLLFD